MNLLNLVVVEEGEDETRVSRVSCPIKYRHGKSEQATTSIGELLACLAKEKNSLNNDGIIPIEGGRAQKGAAIHH